MHTTPLIPPHIFLIGPGGVGKTSVGMRLGPLLGCPFVDLDQEFVRRVAPIRGFIQSQSYSAYVRRNSELFDQLLQEQDHPTVFALSSGFLVTDVEAETIVKNRKLLRKSGISVLLMPSRDFDLSLEIVLARQLQRGLGLGREKQIETFSARFAPYLQLGEVQVFSVDAPEAIACLVREALANRTHSKALPTDL